MSGGRAARLFVAGLVAATAVVTAGSAAGAQPRTVRSGTIIGGYFPGLAYLGPSPSGCTSHAECAAWWASGCSPKLAGRDPGIHDSIVDVRGLPRWGRSNWTLTVSPRHLAGVAPNMIWGGLTLEFWNADCQRVGIIGGNNNEVRTKGTFWMDPATVWMTVASSDNTTLTWTLRRATAAEVRHAFR